MNVIIDEDLNIHVITGMTHTSGNYMFQKEAVNLDGTSTDTSGMTGDMPGTTGKAPLLSSWPVVIGITSATLVISIVIGILLAKRKIKKGFELYED